MSLKATPAMVPTVALFGLVTVNVKVETSLIPTIAGAKALAINGGATATTLSILVAPAALETVIALLVVETTDVTLV